MISFHKDGTLPDSRTAIFVFGSNLAGIHGAGAAKAAFEHFDAPMGSGLGLISPRAYAIATKDYNLVSMSLTEIFLQVLIFRQFTKAFPLYNFFVTRVGCGLAGHPDEVIAPMFVGCQNCSFAEEWQLGPNWPETP